MFSSALGAPRCFASMRPRSEDSLPGMSRSGRRSSCTRLGPTARTARAADTLESMPPEVATTRPRRPSVRSASRMRSAMRSAVTSRSMAKGSAPSTMARGLVLALTVFSIGAGPSAPGVPTRVGGCEQLGRARGRPPSGMCPSPGDLGAGGSGEWASRAAYPSGRCSRATQHWEPGAAGASCTSARRSTTSASRRCCGRGTGSTPSSPPTPMARGMPTRCWAARCAACPARATRSSARSATTSTPARAGARRATRASPTPSCAGRRTTPATCAWRRSGRWSAWASRHSTCSCCTTPTAPATRAPTSGRGWPHCARRGSSTPSASRPVLPTASRWTSSTAWSASASSSTGRW